MDRAAATNFDVSSSLWAKSITLSPLVHLRGLGGVKGGGGGGVTESGEASIERGGALEEPAARSGVVVALLRDRGILEGGESDGVDRDVEYGGSPTVEHG